MRARFSWVLFDWAAQPYFTLITTFIFAPYFAAHFVGDPVRGQALWGYAQGLGSAAIALSAPILGAIADAGGRRKPWIFAFSVLFVLGSWALWYAVPGSGLSVGVVFMAVIISMIGAESATSFTNAMLPELAEPHRLGRLSGTGWAVGYIGGIICLVLLIGVLAAANDKTTTMLGLAPFFSFSGPFAVDRLSGPFTAVWYTIFVIPLFLFVPDGAPSPRSKLRRAVPQGLKNLATTIRSLRRWRNVMRFLIARMLYVDGLTALFAFAAIFATGLFQWSTMEHGLFGILITAFGAIGALAGGPLDDRLGSKRICTMAIAGLILALVGIGSLERDAVFFVIPVDGDAAGGIFPTVSERVFLLLAVVIGVLAGPLQASSRSFMARISPPGQMTEFFGLYALSGKATALVGPFSVAILTQWTGNQKFGLVAVLALLFAGYVILRGVEEPAR